MPIDETKSAYPGGVQVVCQRLVVFPYMRELDRELDKCLAMKLRVSV